MHPPICVYIYIYEKRSFDLKTGCRHRRFEKRGDFVPTSVGKKGKRLTGTTTKKNFNPFFINKKGKLMRRKQNEAAKNFEGESISAKFSCVDGMGWDARSYITYIFII